MHHFSPQHRADLLSTSLSCRGAFTASCGAGMRRFDNPQVELCFSVPASCCSLADALVHSSNGGGTGNSLTELGRKTVHTKLESSLSAAFSAVKLSFELRRTAVSDPHFGRDQLGFCLLRVDDNRRGGRINRKLSDEVLASDVIATSTFQSNDTVSLTVSGSKLLGTVSGGGGGCGGDGGGARRCRVIALLYNSTPFIEADFQFSVVVHQPRRLAEGVRVNIAEIAASAPAFLKQNQQQQQQQQQQQHKDEDDSISLPAISPHSAARQQKELHDGNSNSDFDDDLAALERGVRQQHGSAMDDDDDDDDCGDEDEDWVVPPPLLGGEEDHLSSSCCSSGPSRCSQPLEDEDDEKEYYSPSPPPPDLSDAEAIALAAASRDPDPALICDSLRVLEERSVRFTDTVPLPRAQQHGSAAAAAAGYGNPQAPQFNLLVKRRRRGANSAAADTRKWASVTATIELHIVPADATSLTSISPGAVGGVRFFVSESTADSAAAPAFSSAAAVPRLKGYFPTGDEQLFVERKMQQHRLKRKAIEKQNKMKVFEESEGEEDEFVQPLQQQQQQPQDALAPWNAAAAGRKEASPQSHLLIGGGGAGGGGKNAASTLDSAFSKEGYLTFTEQQHQIRVWRSEFRAANVISLEGISLFSDLDVGGGAPTQRLFRILTCVTDISALEQDCAVHLSVKLFPEPQCSSSSSVDLPSLSVQDFLEDHIIQFCGTEYQPPRIQPRDFVECFPSERSAAESAAVSSTRAQVSAHVIFENIVCKTFLRVDEARAIVDKINQACCKAAELAEHQDRAAARQYSPPPSPTKSDSSSSSPTARPSTSRSSSSKTKKQILFHDPEFPPFTHRSINGPPEKSSSSPPSKNDSPSSASSCRSFAIKLDHLDEKWQRLSELSSNPCMFPSQQQASSSCLPKQSSLIGNCGIVAALAAISKTRNDSILKNAIYPSTVKSSNGTFCHTAYAVSFFVDGDWRAVVVDDMIPCVRGRPAFSTCGSDRHALWVLLYEKALAKVFGCYAALKGAVPMDVAMGLMSGGVGSTVYFQREVVGDEVSSPARRTAALQARVQAYHERGWPMCVSSDRPGEGERIRDESGIVSNHGYSVLSVATTVAESSSSAGPTESIYLLLANPWNFGCEKKKKLRHTVRAATGSGRGGTGGGTFWISLPDLFQEFDYICFCRIVSDELHRRYRFLAPVSSVVSGLGGGGSSSSSSNNNSKWTADPTENAQCVIKLPQQKQKGKDEFLRVRVSADPIGVRGGGFHLHIVPLESLLTEQPSANMTLLELKGLSTAELQSTPKQDEETALSVFTSSSNSSIGDQKQQQQQQMNSRATKFFFTHQKLEELQDAHAQHFFAPVFEADGTSMGSCIFKPGSEYLLLAYRVGSGFDGAFAFTVEVSSSSSSLLFAHLPPPRLLSAPRASFTIAAGRWSTVNPQFLLVNNSKDFSVAVRIECELVMPPPIAAYHNQQQQQKEAKTDDAAEQALQQFLGDGLEVLLLNAPSERDPPMLLNGSTEVEGAIVAASPFFRAGKIVLTAALKPATKYVVMPSRGSGTDVDVNVRVLVRATDTRSVEFLKMK